MVYQLTLEIKVDKKGGQQQRTTQLGTPGRDNYKTSLNVYIHLTTITLIVICKYKSVDNIVEYNYNV